MQASAVCGRNTFLVVDVVGLGFRPCVNDCIGSCATDALVAIHAGLAAWQLWRRLHRWKSAFSTSLSLHTEASPRKVISDIMAPNSPSEFGALAVGLMATNAIWAMLGACYWLQPVDAGALMRIHPDDWRVFRQDPDGYRLAGTTATRPDSEGLAELLSVDGTQGIAAQLNTVDRFLDGLRN